MSKKMIIAIDVEDWKEAYQELGYEIVSKEDLVKLAKEGIKPLELARYTIVSRELGLADQDILPSNKRTLNVGGMYAINQMFARMYKKIQVGKDEDDTLEVRELVCQLKDEDGDLEAVDSESKKGCERAIAYLHRTIIGHTVSRLNIIAVNQGKQAVIDNVDQLIRELEEERDRIVSKFE